VTGGYDGLTGFSRHTLHLFGFDWTMGSLGFYYLVVACFALGALVLWIVLNSPLGHTFVAIRENQKRLTFLGLPVQRYAAISFALSGLIVALAGGLNALLDNFTSPNTLNYTFSGDLGGDCGAGRNAQLLGATGRGGHLRAGAGLRQLGD
jgi:amino acid/amide ABC transporter membrane protein 2, HAAT family (TC 3.A.1.4.-)